MYVAVGGFRTVSDPDRDEPLVSTTHMCLSREIVLTVGWPNPS